MKKMKLNLQLFADGKVVIETDLDSKGFKSGLSKMQSIAKTGFQAVATSVGVAATAITGLVVASTKAYADYEQLVGGVDTLFKNSSKKLQEYADEAYKTAGMSANEYMSTVTSFSASLLQSLGNDTEKATEYANQAVIDMSDNANKMGTSMEMIQNAYQGFAKQNYTMLDNLKLGYGGTKEEMERLIEDANRVKEANGEMADLSIESFADVTEAIHIIQTEMGITGTTAKEADSTITGSLNSVKASWENLMVAMADPNADMSKIFDELIASVKTFGKNVLPIAEEALMGVAELINELLPEIVNSIPSILEEFLPILVEAGSSIITGLITGINDNLDTLVPTILNCIMTIVNLITENLPMIMQMGIQLIIQLGLGIAEQIPQLVPQIVDCILLIAETLIDNLDQIMEAGYEIIFALIEGIFNSLPNLIAKLPELILKLCQALLKLIFVQIPEIGKNLITTLISSIFNFWNNMITKIREFFKGTIIDTLLGKVQDIANVGKNLVQGLWNGINNAKDWVLDKIKGFGSAILDGIKSFFGISSPSKLMKDEVGKYIAEGVGVGFEDELSNVYDDMQKAIDLETEKMSANVQTGSVYNNVMNTIPVQINGNYTSRLEVDGEVLATVVNDVNDKKDLQYMF